MNRSTFRLAVIMICLAVLASFAEACAVQPAIKVGFTAELSGKYSEAGVNLRNGVQMAVDDINASGVIAGRKIELIVVDDLGTSAGAAAAEEKLIAEGAIAVVGHYTSSQTLAGYAVTEPKGVILISGTAATSALNNKMDHFFRTVSTADSMGAAFARYIREKRGLKRLSILSDRDNASYADPLADAFSAALKSAGGEIVDRLTFSESAGGDFSPAVNQLNAGKPDGILIIASPTSTALIAQVARLTGLNIPLFSSGWGQGDTLIQNGGKAVEGMEIIIGIDLNDPSPLLQQFKVNYQKKYSHPPIFTAVEGYETMQMLAAALERTGGKASGLTVALPALKNFQGLNGSIRMNEYGDAVRPFIIQKISAGSFQTIAKENPPDQ
jgi:branched-chain amino acid transport system substrate-binding protein